MKNNLHLQKNRRFNKKNRPAFKPACQKPERTLLILQCHQKSISLVQTETTKKFMGQNSWSGAVHHTSMYVFLHFHPGGADFTTFRSTRPRVRCAPGSRARALNDVTKTRRACFVYEGACARGLGVQTHHRQAGKRAILRWFLCIGWAEVCSRRGCLGWSHGHEILFLILPRDSRQRGGSGSVHTQEKSEHMHTLMAPPYICTYIVGYIHSHLASNVRTSRPKEGGMKYLGSKNLEDIELLLTLPWV